MLMFSLIGAVAFSQVVTAVGVTGTAPGFASPVTGGGNAAPVYPTSIQQLTSYLSDSSPRVIVLNKEFNYIGSEGTTTDTGCIPASNTCGASGQNAINANNWCSPSYPKTSVTYDKAGTQGLTVSSNKSIVGEGSKGVIRGKGLRISNGASNIIIQNIHITDLNPQYIWGGDAITLAGTDLVWIDHVKTSLIGRQHFVTGYSPSNRVTLSNNDFDGETSWSSSCDGHQYWAILLLGQNDKITLVGNYIRTTSGRSPKIGGTTLLHAVNNYWHNNTGHAFDVTENGHVLAEGNVFEDVKTPLLAGSLFAATSRNAAQCSSALGRACQSNMLTHSGSFVGSNTTFFSDFAGYKAPSAMAPGKVPSSVIANAGIGHI